MTDDKCPPGPGGAHCNLSFILIGYLSLIIFEFEAGLEAPPSWD